ncbi:integrin beta-1 [Microplitis demolitor]|uniref:integrin beta-1 n=1 Tax=Microplitis demolitor TaxID=69319 RepID=UPI0004CDD66C|nr:integrin beta-1 [Microplitis demolitor]
MASKILSKLFLITLANTLIIFGDSTNDGIDHEIKTCANHTMECNPELQEPCCDSSTKCKLINNMWKTNSLRYFCYKTIKIGEACDFDDFDCSDDNFARCDVNSTCRCDNYSGNGSDCSPSVSAYCKIDQHCKVENSFCRDGFCICKPGYKQNRSSTECLPN